MPILKSILTFAVALNGLASAGAESRASEQPAGAAVCSALAKYPKASGEKLSFEAGELSAICKPFVKLARHELDRCGDTGRDPYTSATSHFTLEKMPPKVHAAKTAVKTAVMTQSNFTWASRNAMEKNGKINLLADAELRSAVPGLMKHIGDLKESASRLCCGADEGCEREFEKVEVTLCKPSDDPNAPDPCVFGGSFKMPGDGYDAIFRAIRRAYDSESAVEFRRLAERNLSSQELLDPQLHAGITSGNIVLSSYVPRTIGTAALEPIVLHEFGHACSMIHMQRTALAGAQPGPPEIMHKALRAAQWLESARNRCNPDLELPEAYYDFWESLGESRSLAACLFRLTRDNQKQQIDRVCPGLCPGHYLEESVGIAFSLLAGDARGLPSSVFPNTCDHVRDGQHPMVSDVAECLVQNSGRFREKLKAAYGCSG